MSDLLLARRRPGGRALRPGRRSCAALVGRRGGVAGRAVGPRRADLAAARLVHVTSSGWPHESELGGNPVIGAGRSCCARAWRRGRRRPLAAPRPDQPGRRRLGADADVAREAVDDLRGDCASRSRRLAALAAAHRDTPMVARTLTQHAVPTTFGLKVAPVARRPRSTPTTQLAGLVFPDQVGGAAGTRAAMVELGASDPVGVATGVPSAGTGPRPGTLAPVTRLGDAARRAAPTPGRGSPTTSSR